MARDFTVKARIVAQDDASETIGKVESRFGRLGSFLRSNTVLTFGDVTNAISRAVGFMGSFVAAASEAETSSARLATALGDIGPATARVNRELLEQAGALQETTRFSDDQVLAAQTLLLNLGATAEQVPKATKAAVELASAFKIELSQAAALVGRTLQGFATRDIARLIPALKDLDAEALKAGEGVELILARFEGSAAADFATFAGQVAALGNAFDELKEKVGASVTENDAAREALARLREIFKDPEFLSAIETLSGQIGTFINDVSDPEKGIPSILSDLNRVADFFVGLSQFLPDAVTGDEPFFDLPKALSDLDDSLAGGNVKFFLGQAGDWVRGVTEGGRMMRELGAATAGVASANVELETNAGAAKVASDELRKTTDTAARSFKVEGDMLDRATAALIRYSRAKAAAAAAGAGPVTTQGSGTTPTRANTLGG